MRKSFSFWSVAGFVFVSILGTLLHFAYEWSGQRVLVAPFSGVNESVWEHMKLLYSPLLAFALLERRLRRDAAGNGCALLLGAVAGLATIPLLYYTYTGALGLSADWFNIAIFYVAVAVSFWVQSRRWGHCRNSKAAWAALLLLGGLFVLFTFAPPHIPLFRDPLTGQYGVA